MTGNAHFIASLYGATRAHTRYHAELLSFEAGNPARRVDLGCPPHVATATAKAFNRAMQAQLVETSNRPVYEYRGFLFWPDGLDDAWELRRKDCVMDDIRPAAGLFDAMDQIDAILDRDETTNSEDAA
ncbi:hypothetical protein [Pseudooceanicola atlanticus]|uniref:Uncharacterized protein n=1 Tax=Pseudooceanicola atlanticus TaxID=1461694 RepID=A0A0A0EI49_9RHOB|nr:hypothetical protein [Pseudooceanicola atlanticus]KGM50641.1 hypothetical protein ATO9_03955 [Pseudooceanicola atlanticus]